MHRRGHCPAAFRALPFVGVVFALFHVVLAEPVSEHHTKQLDKKLHNFSLFGLAEIVDPSPTEYNYQRD